MVVKYRLIWMLVTKHLVKTRNAKQWTHARSFPRGERDVAPCNKGRGMCYPVCGMVHIKEPLLLIGKSSPCGGSGFPLSLSEWSWSHITVNKMCWVRRKIKTFPSFLPISIYLPTYLPIYLITYLPTNLPTYIPIYLSIYLYIYLPTYLSI